MLSVPVLVCYLQIYSAAFIQAKIKWSKTTKSTLKVDQHDHYFNHLKYLILGLAPLLNN